MAWLTDPIQGIAKQLAGVSSMIPPNVVSQVNAATREALAPPPAQFNAGTPPMTQMQTHAAQPPNAFDVSGQFMSGNSFTNVGMGQQAQPYTIPGMAADMGNQPWQTSTLKSPTGMPTTTTGGNGGTSIIGGQWSTLDGMNSYIDAASAATGVPANLIKAMLAREGSFGNDKFTNPNIRPGDEVYAFNGIFRSTAESRGIDFDRMLIDDAYAIWAMGETLRQIQAETGLDWENTAGYYFAGPNYSNPNWGDETGENTVWNYKYGPTGVVTRWQELDQASGIPTVPAGQFGNNWVVQQALTFVGTPYVWGSIPGAGQDPRAMGWDCSGMTYWLNQTYGDKSLPMGSHYQFDYAQKTGQLFNDVNQLQAGDLVFWDTGNQAGGGAELNRAGHVAVYIGNGQILHAANPSQGTIVSNLSDYLNTYGFLGAMHQSFSGFGGYSKGSEQFSHKGSGFLDYLFG